MCVCLCEAVFLAATNIWFWCLDVDKKGFLEILNVLIHDRSHLTEICLWSAHAEEQRYPLITFIYHDVTTQTTVSYCFSLCPSICQFIIKLQAERST